MKAPLLAALLSLALQAQSNLPQGVERIADIAYASTPEKNLLLDIYRPVRRSAEKLPLVVWIHGGAWRGGAKDNPVQVVGLAARGYAVASISYRLSDEAIYPAQIYDCKAAIRWLRAHAPQYGFDPNRIGAAGSSAGGHLAALLGTSGNVEDLEGEVGDHRGVSSRVQAVVDLFGPTDFLQMDAHSLNPDFVHDAPDSPESQLIGAPIQANPGKAARANPIRYVSADDPPFLIIHGNLDPSVPFNQSELLQAALVEAGVSSQLHRVVGGRHGSGGEFRTPALFERIADFFDRTL